ncbi:amino-acid N-acetyltransferase [Desulfosediminicola flagellatus]|uniref:amino-acid N-acetyltransferase n=1 Tax=Desulfosediminicola flagellatus TaxID=2569541 RepID=UPI0010AC14E1|nr:amino-acid N-acetyltransferase [Desulfosediminicola flagellatus]
MENTNAYFVQWFRKVSPYIHAHRGKTFVILIPGECLAQPDFINIVSDIAILQALGVKVVVVHGARLQIDEELSQAGFSSSFHNGVRITERDHLSFILKAVGIARWRLEALFSSGLPNSPMYGAKLKIRSGNLITAMPQGILDGIDHQMTGKVRSVDVQTIKNILNDNALALLSPLGYSITGEVFNLSFADVGISVAVALQADKALIYNDDGPIYDKSGTLFRQLTLAQCETFLTEETEHAPSNSYFSLRAGYKACKKGVPRSHIISSSEDGTLLNELFTRDGSGTMVYRDSYETTRPARLQDVAGILNLISPLEEKGILVKRSRELLENEIDYFTVLEKDGLVIGCAALYPFAGTPAGELACVAVMKEYQKGGRARKLLNYVEEQAGKLGLEAIYVLTTRTSHWFIEQGFEESTVEELPASRKALYNFQRNSKVLVKNI